MPFVQLKNVKLKYYTIGEGKPVVFIAGFGVDHRTWVPQITFFQDKNKVIVFDNRGIGESTGSPEPYTITMMAEDVICLLDHLKIKKTHVVGSSMGGMIAQELAINHPERVNKLVLSSTTAKADKTVRETILKGFEEMIEGKIDNIVEVNPRRILFEKAFNYILQLTFSEKFIRENKQLIESFIRDYLSKKNYVETLLKQSRAIAKHNTTKRLEKIKAPTLVITGTRDEFISPENSEYLFKHIPNATLVKIVGGTHGMHHERAEEFNEHVLRFFEE